MRRIIGTKVQRLDGPDKATGRAKYSFDMNPKGLLHARMFRSPHAHAKLTKLDLSDAEKVPGFRAHHAVAKEGDELLFAGAEIVAICADTEEHADDCLHAIKAEFEVLPHLVKESETLTSKQGTLGDPATANIQPQGDSVTDDFAAKAYQGAAAIHEGEYGISIISHQCLESHGLVAEWDAKGEKLTVWASTQAVPNTAQGLATHFKLKPTDVRCITYYMGGGFGSKFGPDVQGIAAAELARKTKAPVKLMLDRAEEVTVGGQRPSAYGRVKIAAAKDGKIQAYEVECHGSPGVGKAGTVNFALLPYVYAPAIANIKKKHQIARMNVQTARAMRAPGHPQNCILTDQPIDDLAAKLDMNPLEMRLKNLPANDPDAVKEAPNSFFALRHTIYTREIEIIRKMCEWDKNWHKPGEGKGTIRTGMGMALHTWGGAGRGPNPTKVTISSDGSVLVQSSSQDLGTAQRTVTAIIVAEILGLLPRDITVELGDSAHGLSTPSGGSTTCPGTSPAILLAAENARDELLKTLAMKLNVQPGDLEIQPGKIVNKTNNQQRTWAEACAMLGNQPVRAEGDWPPQAVLAKDAKLRNLWQGQLSNNGVGGVQVAEVKVDIETGVVRCTRFWAVQDCGLIINKLGCESQVAGGVIMGINYALFEEAIYDRQTGRQVNPDMEFYRLGGIQDMPRIYVHMMDMPERGVIGIGEPPTISTAAAIGNAIFNAIGVRVPYAPFTPERVLAALAAKK
jgi:xanthine dehydrogenase YagR molybdenum-binding subunit